MKYSIWFIGCLVIFSLIGCFDDKGTYDYKDLNEPIWNTGDGEPVINVTCRAGEVAKFRASPFFAWKGDSLKRAGEVRYEWKLDGVVIGEEADFDIDTKSRSMRRDEMLPILDKLVSCCVPEENKRAVQQMIGSEKLHYIEPHHGKPILRGLWELGQAVQQRQVLELDYQRLKGTETVRRTVEPVGILFSEYYFYLAAYLRGVDRKQSFENPEDPYPTIYRIDRIRAFCPTGEHFTPAYAKRFQEGEFRKRVQFMYGGKLQKIRFKYTGPSIESVLDRLPTAEILSQDDSGWLVSAEVFGKVIEMWIKSQGEYIETE